MSVPGQTIGVSVFTDSLMRVLGISRVELSLAYLVGTIGSALVLSYAGKVVDRLGARLVGTAVVLLLGVTLVAMSVIDLVSGFLTRLLPFVGAAAAGFVTVACGFFLLRFLGQGVLTLVSRNMAMKWFDRRRGLANAILGTVVSFGFSYAPRVLDSLIETSGWRGAWRILALVLILGFTSLFLLLARDNPWICGLKPDGKASKPVTTSNRQATTGPDLSLAEARRTLTFWAYALTLALFALFVTAMTFHVVSIFEEAGMGRDRAVAIFFPAAVISLIVNFSASWASDRLPLKIFLLLEIGGLMIASAAVARLDGRAGYILLVVGYGVSGGLMNLINSVSWPRFFGIRHLGAVSGFAMGLMVAGSALGPYIFSLSLRYGGSYAAGGWACFALAIAALILALISRPPAYAAEGQ